MARLARFGNVQPTQFLDELDPDDAGELGRRVTELAMEDREFLGELITSATKSICETVAKSARL